ncbi:hypothetical protein CKO51_30240 [Rhodopirellula sp. SM50]|nr:hypothetical protein CKO51_30240 [Rhodopirellula sp. SM50]
MVTAGYWPSASLDLIDRTLSGITARENTHGWQGEPTDPELLFIGGFIQIGHGELSSCWRFQRRTATRRFKSAIQSDGSALRDIDRQADQ